MIDNKVITNFSKIFITDIIGNKENKFETCLIVPFANKAFCFEDWLRGIKTLPTKDMALVVYDNSNSERFGSTIKSNLSKLFAFQVWIKDENKNFTVENTNEYLFIDNRMWDIYSQCMKHVPSCEYIFIIEDDIEIPSGTYDKFINAMKLCPKLGTIVGCANDRRKCDDKEYLNAPIIWNILEANLIPMNTSIVETYQFKKSKEFGVESIGSAHTGCWFTRTNVAQKLKFGTRCSLGFSNYLDQDWGYRINKNNLVIAVDWSVKCKHYSNTDGRKVYV